MYSIVRALYRENFSTQPLESAGKKRQHIFKQPPRHRLCHPRTQNNKKKRRSRKTADLTSRAASISSFVRRSLRATDRHRPASYNMYIHTGSTRHGRISCLWGAVNETHYVPRVGCVATHPSERKRHKKDRSTNRHGSKLPIQEHPVIPLQSSQLERQGEHASVGSPARPPRRKKSAEIPKYSIPPSLR